MKAWKQKHTRRFSIQHDLLLRLERQMRKRNQIFVVWSTRSVKSEVVCQVVSLNLIAVNWFQGSCNEMSFNLFKEAFAFDSETEMVRINRFQVDRYSDSRLQIYCTFVVCIRLYGSKLELFLCEIQIRVALQFVLVHFCQNNCHFYLFESCEFSFEIDSKFSCRYCFTVNRVCLHELLDVDVSLLQPILGWRLGLRVLVYTIVFRSASASMLAHSTTLFAGLAWLIGKVRVSRTALETLLRSRK